MEPALSYPRQPLGCSVPVRSSLGFSDGKRGVLPKISNSEVLFVCEGLLGVLLAQFLLWCQRGRQRFLNVEGSNRVFLIESVLS